MRHDLGVNVEPCEHLIVVLEDLNCVPALLLLGQAVHGGLLDVREGVLHDAGKRVHRNGLAASCSLDRSSRRVRDSVALESGNFNDLAAELAGELLDVYDVAVLAHDVHHVHRNDNGYAELGELGREIEISLEVGAVNDVEYRVGALADEEVSRNDLLKRVRRQRVDARKVNDAHAVKLLELALLFLHRDTGPVADELI